MPNPRPRCQCDGNCGRNHAGSNCGSFEWDASTDYQCLACYDARKKASKKPARQHRSPQMRDDWSDKPLFGGSRK